MPKFRHREYEADEMLRYDLATRDKVEDWIGRVFDKLLPWKPSAATCFRPFIIPESSDSWARREQWNESSEGRAANLKYILEGLPEWVHLRRFMTPPLPNSRLTSSDSYLSSASDQWRRKWRIMRAMGRSPSAQTTLAKGGNVILVFQQKKTPDNITKPL